MISKENIIETIRMIENEKLDIRTITMGICLFDCADSDGNAARKKIYDKISTCAGNLVKVGQDIEAEYGIPIINKRIAVTPISMIARATNEESYVHFARTLDESAKGIGVDLIGGFSALVQKGCAKGERILLESIPEALSSTDIVCSSVNVGTTRAGLYMDVVRYLGSII